MTAFNRFFARVVALPAALAACVLAAAPGAAAQEQYPSQPVKWMESPPGVVEGKQAALRQFQEYGANWVFGCRGTF